MRLVLLLMLLAGSVHAEVDPALLRDCVVQGLDLQLGCASTGAELPQYQCYAKACARLLPPGECRDAMTQFDADPLTRDANFYNAQLTCSRWLVLSGGLGPAFMPSELARPYMIRRVLMPHFGLQPMSLAEWFDEELSVWGAASREHRRAMHHKRMADRTHAERSDPERVTRLRVLAWISRWLWLPLPR